MVVCKQPFCSCLHNCGLSCPSKPIKPKYGGLLKILGPALNLIQHTPSSPLEAPILISIPVSCSPCTLATTQNKHVSFRVIGQLVSIFVQDCLTLILSGHQTYPQTTISMTHNKFQVLIIYSLLACHLDQLPE